MEPDDETSRLRRHWPDRVWRKSVEGNYYLNSDGFNLVVFHQGSEWSLVIRNRETDLSQRARKSYRTMEAAKLAGFDALIWARRNL